MKRHPRRLIDAGISAERYEELQRVCRQYPEYVRTLRRMRAGIVDRKGRSGVWHRPDPTGNAAINLADHPYARRVRMIEEAAAKVAAPAVAAGIIKSVSEGVRYENLRPRPPCGDKQFYVSRQLFFIELDARMWKDENDQ